MVVSDERVRGHRRQVEPGKGSLNGSSGSYPESQKRKRKDTQTLWWVGEWTPVRFVEDTSTVEDIVREGLLVERRPTGDRYGGTGGYYYRGYSKW